MKLPVIQRLIVEDFASQKEWIAPMFSVVNNFITTVGQALKGGLSFEENIAGQEQVLDFVYSTEAATFPKKIKWKLADKPKALSIVEASEETSTTAKNPVILLAAWVFADDLTVTIGTIAKVTTSGVGTLDAGKRYKIRVRITP